MPNKRPRKPAGEKTRISSRVQKMAVSTTNDAQTSAQGENVRRRTRTHTTTVPNKVPTPRELQLLNRVFADDEDKSQEFYVTDVKYHASYKTVCCFCVPYHGDASAAMLSAVILHKSINVDDYIYDCDFVRKNLVGSSVHIHVEDVL
jgi:hypothetical protein